MKTSLNRILANGLVVVGLGFASVGLLWGQRPVAADNSGTIKIHAESTCSGADNEPKPGAEFWVSGSGFTNGVQRWLAVTDGTNASDPVVIGPVSVGTAGTFCAGPFSLAAGHYKAYVGHEGPNVVANHEKTKVFKTVGCPDTTTTLPPDTTTTLPPDTTTTLPPDTTTTIGGESGGPTTTAGGESGGPTTTQPGSLPRTGGSDSMLLLGFGVAGLGVTLRVMAGRRS